ncbi:MAG: Mov34/MPN/PAD-1 family protein [Rhizomicrobium sp.]
MIERLELTEHLRVTLSDEARRAYPRECCGLIEGVCDGSVARATALHPTANLAAAPDRFEVDPAAHIALLRRLRGSGRSVIGCYHSHPNGKSGPSARDLESAAEEGFLWLIAALEKRDTEPHLAGFVSTGRSFVAVRMEA